MWDRPRMFYGWWIVAACSLGLFLSTGTVVVLSFGVFLKPLMESFHAGRASVSFAFTLHNLTAAICIPLIGRLIDRLGARRVILTGTAIFASILICAALLGVNILYLYLFYTALGLVAGSTAPVSYGVIVSYWFDRRRGMALGLMMVGLGLGAIVLPLIAHRLITVFGWRAAYAGFGCAALVLSLPVTAALLKNDPKEMGLFPDGATLPGSVETSLEELEGLSWSESFRQSTFWILISAFFLAGASVHACAVHMAALLTDRGTSAQGAAMATSLVGLALLLGRVGTGYLLDRFFAPRVAVFLFGGASLGIALLWLGSTGNLALFAAFLIGMGMGAEGDIIAFCMSRYFGLRSFGTTFGVGFGAFVLAGALGVFVMGAGFDLTRSYTAPLGVVFFFMITAVGLMTRLGPYRYAARPESRALELANAESTNRA